MADETQSSGNNTVAAVITTSSVLSLASHVFANAAARALDVPDKTGQFGFQSDTGIVYVSTGTSAGNWSIQTQDSCLKYVALLTQTGTAAPVATILQNTTGATLTWARTDTGVYTLTSSVAGLFVAAKLVINSQNATNVGDSPYTLVNNTLVNTTTILNFTSIILASNSIGGLGADVSLLKTFIEIRIYS